MRKTQHAVNLSSVNFSEKISEKWMIWKIYFVDEVKSIVTSSLIYFTSSKLSVSKSCSYESVAKTQNFQYI